LLDVCSAETNAGHLLHGAAWLSSGSSGVSFGDGEADLDGTSLTIYIYDPDYIGDDNTITLDTGNPAHTTPVTISNNPSGFFRGFFRTHYEYHDPRTPICCELVGESVVTSSGIIAFVQTEGIPAPAYQENIDRLVVFTTESDGRLHDKFWNGSEWVWEDQGTPPNVDGVVSPSAVYQTSIDRLVVFVVGTDGRLYDKFWNGSEWVWEDQGVQ
jgi:hypothetical protein